MQILRYGTILEVINEKIKNKQSKIFGTLREFFQGAAAFGGRFCPTALFVSVYAGLFRLSGQKRARGIFLTEKGAPGRRISHKMRKFPARGLAHCTMFC